MNNGIKTIAIIAGIMVALGLILAAVGVLAGGNQDIQFGKGGFSLGNKTNGFFSGKMEVINEGLDPFKNIDIDLSIYDVDLIPSDKYALECTYDSEYGKPSFKVENDTLTITENNKNGINFNIDIFDFNFSNRENQGIAVKIYYPSSTTFGKVGINCNAADLSFEKLNAEEMTFHLDFGKLELQEMAATKVVVKMNSGDCKIKNIKGEDLRISNSFGKTEVVDAELKILVIDANSGDVSVTDTIAERGDLSLDFGRLSSKNFKTKSLKVESNSGDVDLQGTFLGDTDVQCDMGKITVDTDVPKDQYSYELNVNMGSVYIGGDKMSTVTSGNNAGASNKLKLDANMGDIKVSFK